MNTPKPINRNFYLRDSIIVAQDLLGKYLVRGVGNKFLTGIIVETEAYTGLDDPASHSFIGRTKRNEILFGEAGHAYIHNMHRQNLLDIVTQKEGISTSVLIRAIEPVEGIEVMMENRGTDNLKNLTNGPGKLCQALNITREMNGIDMTDADSGLFVAESTHSRKIEITSSGRVGISKAKDRMLRYYVKGSEFVSKK